MMVLRVEVARKGELTTNGRPVLRGKEEPPQMSTLKSLWSHTPKTVSISYRFSSTKGRAKEQFVM